MASLKVAVRVRPFNQREVEMEAKCVVQMDGKKTRLLKPKLSTIDNNSAAAPNRDNYNDFTFDHSYWSFEGTCDSLNGNNQHIVTQEEVYHDLGTDVIKSAFEGYNACVFAYGQTGSGKTFTMMGSPEKPGLIPRICREMFTRMKLGEEAGTGYKTQVSYLEIYNERVKDLLSGSSNAGHALRVREHRTLGPYVENLSQHPVTNYREIQECIDRGNTLRTTASTNMNDTSSRSHAIFTITFVQAVFMDQMPSETVSKIHLVDLAGSERANATGATGDRLKEGAHINKSLVSLGSVISALAEQSQTPSNQPNVKKAPYIPYRDSVLTWLLKDSLGGNSKTIMIAALSPADCNYSETLSTLRYANRAKNIINKPTINEDPNVKLIRELREEIQKLKNMLHTGDCTDVERFEKSSKMLEDLLKKEAQEKVLTEEWAEKWKQAQSILREQKALGLRKSGVGVVLDSEAPHLIGIHDDISTGVTLYSLKEGETIIGNNDEDPEGCESRHVDIVLRGIGISAEQCSIHLTNGTAVIHPKPGAQCWLNAIPIEEPTSISQGDILLLGPTNMFRYNNPAEAAKLRDVPNRARSRADLSRLSLIAASRENLNGSMFCSTDEDMFNSQGMFGGKKLLSTVEQNESLQDNHRKILETIKSALNKLNSERIHMNKQHKAKVQQLSEELARLEQQNSDKLAILNCREEFYAAKREMIFWDKSNKKTQIDIGVTQISAIQTELETKKVELQEFVAKEFEELQESGKLNEMIKSNILNGVSTISPESLCSLLQTAAESLIESGTNKTTGQRIHDIIMKKKDVIHQVETELVEKEELLNENIREIADLDEALLLLDDERKILHAEMSNFGKTDKKTRKISDCNIQTDDVRARTSELDINSNPRNGDLEVFDDAEASTSANHQQFTDSRSRSEMNLLRQKIASQKAQIMKNLELNNCDKTKLDDEIMKLQSLQKRYFNYEKDMQYGDEMRSEGCLSSDETELESELIYRDTSDENSNSSESRVGSRRIHNDGAMGQRYLASTITSRSQSSMDNNYESEYVISIPSYIIRGAGKQTHVEYEVRITLVDEKWTLLRRYSRFRELHLTMKTAYGEKVTEIPFPRRELFASNSESVARNRRRQLESYLRRLLVVCSKIPQCPIFEGADGFGLSKVTLAEFSPFFKKGLFESGKHGTG